VEEIVLDFFVWKLCTCIDLTFIIIKTKQNTVSSLHYWRHTDVLACIKCITHLHPVHCQWIKTRNTRCQTFVSKKMIQWYWG